MRDDENPDILGDAPFGEGNGSTGATSDAVAPLPAAAPVAGSAAAPMTYSPTYPFGAPWGTAPVPAQETSSGTRFSRHRAAYRTVGLGAAIVLSAAASGLVVHSVDDSNRSSAASTPLVAAANSNTATAVSTVQSALAKAEKSVIIINDTITSTSASGNSGGGFGGYGDQSFTESAAGTGIIISASGEAVTNAHVVNGATSITVTLPDGTKHSATVVGLNATEDLAVIKISGVSGLTPATWADSSTEAVGDTVIAIGNAEGYGGSPTVTEGILSATNRSLASSSSSTGEDSNLTGLLQTDAAINPGNSGGPLIDTAGDVIGIDTAIAAGTSSEPAQNIGFAIPSDTITTDIPALENGAETGNTSTGTTSGGSTTTAKAYLGVSVADGNGGALVESVVSGSPASGAGVEEGDLITALNGKAISDASDLATAIAADSPNQKVSLTIVRSGATMTVQATLAAPSS